MCTNELRARELQRIVFVTWLPNTQTRNAEDCLTPSPPGPESTKAGVNRSRLWPWWEDPSGGPGAARWRDDDTTTKRLDGLAGVRQSLPRSTVPHDQDWWIKEMLRRVPIGLLVRLPGEVEVGRRPYAPSTSTVIGVDVTVAASSNASTVRNDHRVLS